MTEFIIGDKWLVKFKNKDGSENMGFANHHGGLPVMINMILNEGGYGITISDETVGRRTKDKGEIYEQQCSEVHTGAIGYSPVEEHE